MRDQNYTDSYSSRGARFPSQFAVVRLDSDAKHYEFTTGKDGRYAIAVSAGKNRFSMKRPGRCDLRRADAQIASGQSLEFDFRLVSCPSIDRMYSREMTQKELARIDKEDRANAPYQYEDLAAPPSSSLRPLVAYRTRSHSRSRAGHQMLYLGPHVEFFRTVGKGITYGDLPVVFSYSVYTLCADQLIYDPEHHVAIGEGHATWGDGVSTKSDAKITLDLTNPAFTAILQR